MANTSWLTGHSGAWTDGANWSGGVEPGAADTVVIAAAPSLANLPYTVTLAAADQVSVLTLAQAQASLVVDHVSLAVSDHVALTAGNLVLSYGTLTGTSASSYAVGTGGAVSLLGYSPFFPSNEISDLAWHGTLSLLDGSLPNLGSASVVLNDVTFAGAGGSGQGSLSAGTNVLVYINGTAPLDHVAVSLASGASLIGADVGLSIGSDATIAAAAYTSLGGTNITNAGTITAQAGTIGLHISTQGSFLNTGSLLVSNGASLVLQSASGSNSGLISAGAGYLQIEATNGFTNTGQVSVAGGTLSLGFALTTAQAAAYGVKNGTLGISGALDNTGATLTAGTLAGDQAQHLLLDGGTIIGGTITAAGLAFDHGTTYAISAGTLSGVTFNGDLRLSATDLTVENGFTQTAPAHDPHRIFLSQGSTLTFAGNETLSHTNIVLQAGGNASVVAGSFEETAASTLTLDAASTVIQAGHDATLAAASGGQDSVISEGKIYADVSGGTLTANGLTSTGLINLVGEDLTGLAVNAGRINAGGNATLSFGYFGPAGLNSGLITESGSGNTLTISGALSNTGTIIASKGATLSLQTSALTNTGLISVSNGVLEVGTLTTAQLAGLHLTKDTLDVTGRLTLGDTPLRVGNLSPSLQHLSVSGTLASGYVFVGTNNAAEFSGDAGLDGVHFNGIVDVAHPLATLTVSDDTTFAAATGGGPGTIKLTGTGDSLVWDSGQAFDNATLDIGSAGTGYEGQALGAATLLTGSTGLYYSPGNAVQLGAGLTIQQTGAFAAIGDSVSSASGTLQAPMDAFDSHAAILAGAAGGLLTIGGASFTNAGALAISRGETVTVAATAFTNTGTVSIGAGSTLALNLLSYYVSRTQASQSFTNTGSIVLAGGTLTELTDGGSLPAVPLLNNATISGAGTISAAVLNNKSIAAIGGTLTVTGPITGRGSLLVGAGATLSLALGTGGETVSFAGAHGVLAFAGASLGGPIADFAAGDAIDLLGTAATAAAFSGRSIAITLANGSKETLATISAQTGSLTTRSDGHGGTFIAFAGASAAHEVRLEPFWAAFQHAA